MSRLQEPIEPGLPEFKRTVEEFTNQVLERAVALVERAFHSFPNGSIEDPVLANGVDVLFRLAVDVRYLPHLPVIRPAVIGTDPVHYYVRDVNNAWELWIASKGVVVRMNKKDVAADYDHVEAIVDKRALLVSSGGDARPVRLPMSHPTTAKAVFDLAKSMRQKR